MSKHLLQKKIAVFHQRDTGSVPCKDKDFSITGEMKNPPLPVWRQCCTHVLYSTVLSNPTGRPQKWDPVLRVRENAVMIVPWCANLNAVYVTNVKKVAV